MHGKKLRWCARCCSEATEPTVRAARFPIAGGHYAGHRRADQSARGYGSGSLCRDPPGRGRGHGGVPTLQKKLNLHYCAVARPVRFGSVDQRGSTPSTRASRAATARRQIDDDHRLESATYPVLKFVDGEIRRVDEPALTAVNMRLRDDYTQDCASAGCDAGTRSSPHRFRLQARVAACRLPWPDRRVQGHKGDARGRDARRGRLEKRSRKWLPSTQDGDFIARLMSPESEPGRIRRLDRRRSRSASTTSPAILNT